MKTATQGWVILSIALALNGEAVGQELVSAPATRETSTNAPATPVTLDDHQVRYAVVPGPLYSPSLGWGLMVIPMMTFKVDPADEVSPASSFSAFLLGTENNSFVAGIGPKLYLCEDTWRLSGSAGYGRVKEKFYGIGATDPDQYVDMTSEMILGKVEALYRAYPSVFVGPSLQYRQVRFDGDDPTADQVLEAAGLNSEYEHNVAPGLVAQFDTRDDQVAPGKGVFIDTNIRYSSEALGSSSSYERVGLACSQYLTLWNDPRHVLAMQGSIETGFGDVPFDEYPDLGGQKALRGYVKGEFTDKNMAAVQAEYRWNAWKKVGLTAFGGVGKVFPAWDEIGDARWLPSGGVGVRYLIIPERRMNARLDFAWGELGPNFYFSVGEAF